MSELQKAQKFNLSNAKDLLDVGKQLKSFIQKNGLSTRISGKDYAHVDAWKFAGSCFGLTAIVGKPEKKHSGEMMRISFANQTFQGKNGSYTKEVVVYYGFLSDHEGYQIVANTKKITRELIKPYYAYECDCEIVRINGTKAVGNGTGFCSNLEASKALFDEYSVNSTCQTRSIGKAYRNLLGYIMNEAGYQSTPAEEMDEDHIKESSKNTASKSGKMTMDKSQVNGTLLKISKGEITDMDTIEKFFDISDDQRASFQSMFDSRK